MKYPMLDGVMNAYMRRVQDVKGRIPCLMDGRYCVVLDGEDFITIADYLRDTGRLDLIDYKPSQHTKAFEDEP